VPGYAGELGGVIAQGDVVIQDLNMDTAHSTPRRERKREEGREGKGRRGNYRG
jgi:hypothetical protein